MVPVQAPVPVELLIGFMLVLLPVAALYVGYKLIQGFKAFEEGVREA